jgi:hypothetical protein
LEKFNKVFGWSDMTIRLVKAGIAATYEKVEEKNANFCLYILTQLKMENEIQSKIIENIK